MKWVIFDLGKTLIIHNPEKEREVDASAAKWLNSNYNLTLTVEEYIKTRNETLNQMRKEMWGDERRHNPELMFKNLMKRLNIEVDEGGKQFWGMYDECSELMPNAIEILEYSKEKYKLGLISNGSKDGVHRVLKRLDIEKYFDDIISSEEHGEKSTLKPFKKFLEKNSAAAEDCIMVGDRKDEDMYAKKLGMKTVLFAKAANHYGDALEPDYIIHDLIELKKLFDNQL